MTDSERRKEAVQAEIRERALIELARRHPRYLAEACFTIDRNGEDGRPLPMIPEPFHLEWLQAALAQREVLILAARGHAKSEWFSAVLPAWLIGNKPATRVVHVTSTEALATMYSRRMMGLMTNPSYRRVFPELPRPGKKWTETEWELARSGSRDPTWRCAGRGGAITGGRADCLAAGTMIETKRGPIEIKRLVGLKRRPRVLSFDHQNSRLCWSRVVAARETLADGLIEIKTPCLPPVLATADHRFYEHGGEYRPARQLKVGDWLRSVPSDYCLGCSLTEPTPLTGWRVVDAHVGVYDIQVEGTHNFFANGILVHNCIIADDVVTLETCGTPGERERTWQWFTKTLMPMLVPGGKVFIPGTPYNEDDLYQRLRVGGMVPMVYPAEDPEGKILWPGRFPREELDKRRTPPLGTPASYASQYLCNPVPEEGAMLKREWWRYYDELPDVYDVMISSWDMAFKGSDGSDGRSWVVGQVWGRRGIRFYLLDQVRGRWDFVETLDQVRALARRWPQAIAKLVEDAANGPAVVSALTADERNGVGGLYLVKIGRNESKEARASAVSPLLRAGNVYLPREAPWLQGFLQECLAFPNSAFSDQVDALTLALNHFIRSGDWLPAETDDPDADHQKAQDALEQEDFEAAIERMKRRSEQYQRRQPSSGWTKTT